MQTYNLSRRNVGENLLDRAAVGSTVERDLLDRHSHRDLYLLGDTLGRDLLGGLGLGLVIRVSIHVIRVNVLGLAAYRSASDQLELGRRQSNSVFIPLRSK